MSSFNIKYGYDGGEGEYDFIRLFFLFIEVFFIFLLLKYSKIQQQPQIQQQ